MPLLRPQQHFPFSVIHVDRIASEDVIKASRLVRRAGQTSPRLLPPLSFSLAAELVFDQTNVAPGISMSSELTPLFWGKFGLGVNARKRLHMFAKPSPLNGV